MLREYSRYMGIQDIRIGRILRTKELKPWAYITNNGVAHFDRNDPLNVGSEHIARKTLLVLLYGLLIMVQFVFIDKFLGTDSYSLIHILTSHVLTLRRIFVFCF